MQSYLNAAARTDALLIKFPPAAQTSPAKPVPSKLAAPFQPSPETKALHAAKPGSDSNHRKRGPQVAEETLDEDGASHKKKLKVEQASAAAINTALLDDDIDWTATSATAELELASASNFEQKSENKQDTDDTHLKQAEVKSALAEAPSQPHASNAAEKLPDNGRDAGNKEIHQAVAGYVKALLDPFYKAGIVDREVDVLLKLSCMPSPDSLLFMVSHLHDIHGQFWLKHAQATPAG